MLPRHSSFRQVLRSWFGAGQGRPNRRPKPRSRPTLEILEDRAVPAVTALLDPASDTPAGFPPDGRTSDTTPTVNGTHDPATSNEIKVFDGNSELGVATVDAVAMTWTFTVPAALQEGTVTLTAKGIDAAGQEVAGETADLTFTVDISPPFPGPTLMVTSKNGTSVNFAGTGEMPGGNSITLVDAANNLLGATTVDPNGNWQLTAILPVGTHDVRVEEKDGAGNFQQSSSLTVTVMDAPPPAPPPAPAPKPKIRLTASLFTKKVGKKKVMFVQITSSAGGAPKEIRSPYQKPSFKGLAVVVVDTNNDGSDDGVEISARKGKKLVHQVLSV